MWSCEAEEGQNYNLQGSKIMTSGRRLLLGDKWLKNDRDQPTDSRNSINPKLTVQRKTHIDASQSNCRKPKNQEKNLKHNTAIRSTEMMKSIRQQNDTFNILKENDYQPCILYTKTSFKTLGKIDMFVDKKKN